MAKKTLAKGKFITFEGSEGCGKSTQSKLLFLYLKKKGLKTVYLREPGGSKISEKIRDLLLDPKNRTMSKESEMLLYMSASSQVVNDIIKPSLDQGKIIICDRFLDSTLAYQGFGLGIDIKVIKAIGNFATIGLDPDLTILLDLSVKDGLKHRQFTKDRIERRSVAYHLKVRKGYLKLARNHPDRIKVVKVDKDKNKTQENIRKIVKNKLKI